MPEDMQVNEFLDHRWAGPTNVAGSSRRELTPAFSGGVKQLLGAPKHWKGKESSTMASLVPQMKQKKSLNTSVAKRLYLH